MITSDKQQLYSSLVQQRKKCKACGGVLINPADCNGDLYDSFQIGPWSRWQGNLQAKLMVVGQDWGDTNYFLKWEGFDDPNNPTNVNLTKLLNSIGINIKSITGADQGGDIFLTNAILCLKQNGLQGDVVGAWFENCGKNFLKPTIEIVKPKVLVALGEWPYKTILQAYDIRYVRPQTYRMIVEQVGKAGGRKLPGGALLFPVYHCGRRGVNQNRNWSDQLNDWKLIQQAL
jgi:uracil-DNA glycosylase